MKAMTTWIALRAMTPSGPSGPSAMTQASTAAWSLRNAMTSRWYMTTNTPTAMTAPAAKARFNQTFMRPIIRLFGAGVERALPLAICGWETIRAMVFCNQTESETGCIPTVILDRMETVILPVFRFRQPKI